jgi:NitT/TauT family transport system substrate-binding protein
MRALRIVSLLLVALMVVVGCGGGKDTKDTKKPASASKPAATDPKAAEVKTEARTEAVQPKEMTKVKLAMGGTKSSILFLPSILAEYAGFYKEEGIEIEFVEMKGGSQASQALVSGEVDVASNALDHVVKSQAQGVDIVMLALYNRFPSVALVVDSKYKDQIKSVADLKGKKVGVTSRGSGTDGVLHALMSKAGLVESDLEILGVGSDTMPEALKSGKVVAAVGLDPYVTELVASGKAFVLSDMRTEKDTRATYGSDMPFAGLTTRGDVLKKNPQLAARLARAIIKANKYLASHTAEEIAAILPAAVKGDNEVLYIASLKANLEAFAPDGIATEDGVNTVINLLKKDNVISGSAQVTPDKVFIKNAANL